MGGLTYFYKWNTGSKVFNYLLLVICSGSGRTRTQTRRQAPEGQRLCLFHSSLHSWSRCWMTAWTQDWFRFCVVLCKPLKLGFYHCRDNLYSPRKRYLWTQNPPNTHSHKSNSHKNTLSLLGTYFSIFFPGTGLQAWILREMEKGSIPCPGLCVFSAGGDNPGGRHGRLPSGAKKLAGQQRVLQSFKTLHWWGHLFPSQNFPEITRVLFG